MDMPTPCPECNDVVEFTDMVNCDNEMICDDCADGHRCESCGTVSKETVDDTSYGLLCGVCYFERVAEDCAD